MIEAEGTPDRLVRPAVQNYAYILSFHVRLEKCRWVPERVRATLSHPELFLRNMGPYPYGIQVCSGTGTISISSFQIQIRLYKKMGTLMSWAMTECFLLVVTIFRREMFILP